MDGNAIGQGFAAGLKSLWDAYAWMQGMKADKKREEDRYAWMEKQAAREDADRQQRLDRQRLADELAGRTEMLNGIQALNGLPEADVTPDLVDGGQLPLPSQSLAQATSGWGDEDASMGVPSSAPVPNQPTKMRSFTVPGVKKVGIPDMPVRPRTREEQQMEARGKRAEEDATFQTGIARLPKPTQEALTASRILGTKVTPSDLVTPEAKQAASDATYEKRARFNESLRRGRPSAIPQAKDNPRLPIGVEQYLGRLQMGNTSRDQAEAELKTAWPSLVGAHPNLSWIEVNKALDTLWPLDADGQEKRPRGASDAPPLTAGASTAAPVASHASTATAATPAGQKVATQADVEAVAAQLKITPAEARAQLEARGVVIR